MYAEGGSILKSMRERGKALEDAIAAKNLNKQQSFFKQAHNYHNNIAAAALYDTPLGNMLGFTKDGISKGYADGGLTGLPEELVYLMHNLKSLEIILFLVVTKIFLMLQELC